MDINLNQHVTFTLTEAGAAALNEIEDYWATRIPGKTPRTYKAGKRLTKQLWAVMRDFGPRMSVGLPNVIEDNILTLEE